MNKIIDIEEQKIEDITEWKETLTEEKQIWITKIENYGFIKELVELQELNALRTNTENSQTMYLIRGEEGWEEAVCPIERIDHVTRLNRDWTPEIIEDVLMKRRHPLSLRII